MIRRRHHDGWVLIRQRDHAALSGALMALWGNGIFVPPSPRDEVLFGIAEHDMGWDDWDRSPEIHAESGYPLNFNELTSQAYTAIWRRGVNHHRKRHPYASLLIALHTEYLARSRMERIRAIEDGRSREEAAILESFLAENEKIRMELHDAVMAQATVEQDRLEGEARSNFRLLQIGNLVSLVFCGGLSRLFSIDRVPTQVRGPSCSMTFERVTEDTLAVSPYPFSQPDVALTVPGRILRQQVFASGGELQDLIQVADPITLTLCLTPA